MSPAESPSPGTVQIIPLGGLGEIGKNMMAFEYGDAHVRIGLGRASFGEGLAAFEAWLAGSGR